MRAACLLLLLLVFVPCISHSEDTTSPRTQLPVTALAYSPDGKLLAAGVRGEVHLLEADSGDMLYTLSGQGPKVTALAFRSDGKFLAVASGTPGKRGEVRLYSVNEWDKPPLTIPAHQDLIHAVAFSPDGKLLATCSYDRLVKLWDVASSKLVRELKDHSDAVYGVAFHPKGHLLASCAADRTAKVWDVATGKRLYSLSEATDWLYTVAWSPDGKSLAAAGVDKSIRVWEATAEQGRLVQSAFVHEKPVWRLEYSKDGKTLYSLGEDRILKAWDTTRLVERQVYPRQPETVQAFVLRPDQPQVALGRFDGKSLVMDLATGKTITEPLPARFPLVMEKEPNDIPSQGQTITLPAMVVGKLDKAGDVDYYRFEAQQFDAVGMQVIPSPGSNITPEVELINPHGHVVATAHNGTLGHDCIPGWYTIKVRDREFKGGKKMSYRLKLGPVPVVTRVFPLGLQRGTQTEVSIYGVHLSNTQKWGLTLWPLKKQISAPADAAIGSRILIPFDTPWKQPVNPPGLVVGEYGENTHYEHEPIPREHKSGPRKVKILSASIHIPSTAEGLVWSERDESARLKPTFFVRKGQRLVLEVEASRFGTPLDSVMEILDKQGKPVPRAVLRSVGLTYTIFRDHDANGSGVRIENWNNLAINDYVYVGNELLRIRELPKNPDDDCQFWTEAGRRKGFLGTTPNHLSLGLPIYKVEIHPPGATFPPNGYPVFTLNWRNDDGGAGFSKDSYLLFDPPADGEYQVRITDALGRSGPEFAYRLTIRPPRPSFTVDFSPKSPSVWKGGAVPITVTTKRMDGYDGPIEIRLTDLPPGFQAPVTTIPVGEESTTFALFAEKNATVSPGQPLCKLIAKAMIDGKEIEQEIKGGTPKAVEPGEIVTTTPQSEITVQPGGQVRVTVHVERRLGFQGRIPIEVRGLPHGVRVLDIGLNGILITEKETVRTFIIYCEPWVQPQEHPIVILAKHEGKNTSHAAPSVLLRIRPRH
jgi:WD40 repeat protein